MPEGANVTPGYIQLVKALLLDEGGEIGGQVTAETNKKHKRTNNAHRLSRLFYVKHHLHVMHLGPYHA